MVQVAKARGVPPYSSQNMSHKNNFDLIRLLAALQVVVGHSREHLNIESTALEGVWSVLKFFPGVPIFFVLSGFLISASYERNPVFLDYSWNRCLRIFPALWVCLAVSVALVIFAGHRFDFGPAPIVWLTTQVLAISVYNPDFLRGYGTGVLNGSLWTIPVEIQFYLSIPVVYWAFGLTADSRSNRRQSSWLFVLVVVLFGLREWLIPLGHPEPTLASRLVFVTLFPYLGIFLLGVLIQRNFERWQNVFVGRAGWWCAAFVIATWGMHASGVTCVGNRLNPASVLLLAGVTISVAYTLPNLSARLLRHNDVSYGVYIYHMPVINYLIYRRLDNGLLSLLTTLVATVVLAILSWQFVERPALTRKRRRLGSTG